MSLPPCAESTTRPGVRRRLSCCSTASLALLGGFFLLGAGRRNLCSGLDGCADPTVSHRSAPEPAGGWSRRGAYPFGSRGVPGRSPVVPSRQRLNSSRGATSAAVKLVDVASVVGSGVLRPGWCRRSRAHSRFHDPSGGEDASASATDRALAEPGPNQRRVSSGREHRSPRPASWPRRAGSRMPGRPRVGLGRNGSASGAGWHVLQGGCVPAVRPSPSVRVMVEEAANLGDGAWI
jgi:hypothetical protein